MATNLVHMLLLIFLPPLFEDPIVCYFVRASLIKEWTVIFADEERRARVRNMGQLTRLDMLAPSCDFSYSWEMSERADTVGWTQPGSTVGHSQKSPSNPSLACSVSLPKVECDVIHFLFNFI